MRGVADLAVLRPEVAAVRAAEVADRQPRRARVLALVAARHPQRRPDQPVGAPAAPAAVRRRLADRVPGEVRAALGRQLHAAPSRPAYGSPTARDCRHRIRGAGPERSSGQRAERPPPAAPVRGASRRSRPASRPRSKARDRDRVERGARGHRSLTSASSTGLTSTIGVPSIASRFRTWTRSPSTESDLDPVEPDRVRPVRRARAEDALQRARLVASRVDLQDVAVAPVEPGEDDHVVARPDPVERLGDLRLEHEPRVRRALVALLGRRGEVRERRLHPPDRPSAESRHPSMAC